MDSIKQVINDSYKNIDNDNSLNIDNSIDIPDNGKYSLKASFKPRTKESSAAKEIAEALSDEKNFAFYYWVVNQIGPARALQVLSETKDDVKRGTDKDKPIRNPAALYNWKAYRQIR